MARPSVEEAGLRRAPPGQLALTEYTDEDKAWLRESQRSKLLDEGVQIVGVANRHPATGRPRVLACYPLRAMHDLERSRTPSFSVRKWDSAKGAAPVPFPNTFWLVCPEATTVVGALEHKGLVKAYRERLLGNAEEQESFRAAHASCGELRWGLLSEEDRAYAAEQGYEPVIRDTGIGGLRYFNQVKCLHLHYAHFLATGSNIVGEWIQDAIDNLQ